jgi:hypothetical protein
MASHGDPKDHRTHTRNWDQNIKSCEDVCGFKGWAHVNDFGNRFQHQWTNESGKKNFLKEKFNARNFQIEESWTQIVNWNLLIFA